MNLQVSVNLVRDASNDDGFSFPTTSIFLATGPAREVVNLRQPDRALAGHARVAVADIW